MKGKPFLNRSQFLSVSRSQFLSVSRSQCRSVSKGNNKITELRTILQRESQNS